MGLLDRLGRKGSSSAPRFQPDGAMGHAGALAFRAQLRAGQFEDALGTYGALTAGQREFYVSAATGEESLEGGDIPGWSTTFVERHPDRSLAWTIRGGLGIAAGWEARTGSRAQHVEASAWDVFYRFLNEAEDDLQQAAVLDPGDASPWCKLVTSARGLQISKEELRDRFQRAISLGDDLFFVYEHALQGVCRKWGGSHEEMFEFARETAAASPAGSPRHALIVDAHLEQWIDLDCKPSEYFRGAPAREIESAAGRSVLHAAFVDDDAHPYGAAARNVFAVGLVVSGAQRAAWTQASLLGPRLAEWPWYYLGDPADRFAYVLERGPGR